MREPTWEAIEEDQKMRDDEQQVEENESGGRLAHFHKRSANHVAGTILRLFKQRMQFIRDAGILPLR